MRNKFKILKKIYSKAKNPGSLTRNVDSIYRTAQNLGHREIRKIDVKKFLENEPTANQYIKKKYKEASKSKLISLECQLDVDCAYMTRFPRHQNADYAYFVCSIDILTNYCRCSALKSLKSEEVSIAVRRMLLDADAKKVRTDLGSEFRSSVFKTMCSNISVKNFYSSNKAYLCERIIGVLKLKLIKLMEVNSNKKWYIHLQDIVDSYNNTKQKRALKGYSPKECSQMSRPEVFLLRHRPLKPKLTWTRKRAVPSKRKVTKFKYPVGSVVRVSLKKDAFHRLYSKSYSDEKYIVGSRYLKNKVKFYDLKRFNNEKIEGAFLESELSLAQPISKFKISSILEEKRDNNGTVWVKVLWAGMSDNDITWIRKNELNEVL